MRLQIFHSFIQSHLNNCSLISGFTNKSNIESLFIQQKKGIRAIMPGTVASITITKWKPALQAGIRREHHLEQGIVRFMIYNRHQCSEYCPPGAALNIN